MSIEGLRRSKITALQRQMDKADRELRRDVARGHGPMFDLWRRMNAPAPSEPVDGANEGRTPWRRPKQSETQS